MTAPFACKPAFPPFETGGQGGQGDARLHAIGVRVAERVRRWRTQGIAKRFAFALRTHSSRRFSSRGIPRISPGRALLAATLLLLTACATQSPRTTLPAIAGDPQTHQQQRQAALAAMGAWSLTGRVALSNGREGGSGRIDWRQLGPRYEIELSAPVTRQSWRLTGAPGAEVVLDGLEGGARRGTDAQALLREATRWDIPVDALAQWARGTAADPARHGPATLAFGADGRLTTLEQDGWRIAYSGWQPAPGTTVELPGRLDATRGEARVRLVVDQWQPGG